MSTPDMTAAARFLLVRDLPLVVVDLDSDGEPRGGGLTARMVEHLGNRGLVTLPAFFGVELPRGARVGFTVTRELVRLEDEDETVLLRVPRASAPPEWLDRALELKGTMVVVGRDLGADPDQTAGDLAGLVDVAARDGRVLGAIVGVAEPVEGLPLFF